MIKRICILSCLTIAIFNSNAQGKKLEEQFYKQFDNCGFDGNSINDYIVKVFNDSTIEVQIYFRTCNTNSRDYYVTDHSPADVDG